MLVARFLGNNLIFSTAAWIIQQDFLSQMLIKKTLNTKKNASSMASPFTVNRCHHIGWHQHFNNTKNHDHNHKHHKIRLPTKMWQLNHTHTHLASALIATYKAHSVSYATPPMLGKTLVWVLVRFVSLCTSKGSRSFLNYYPF